MAPVLRTTSISIIYIIYIPVGSGCTQPRGSPRPRKAPSIYRLSLSLSLYYL